MGSTGDCSPGSTLPSSSVCLAPSTCPSWHLTSAILFSERHPRPHTFAMHPAVGGTSMYVLNRGGKGVRSPVDAL